MLVEGIAGLEGKRLKASKVWQSRLWAPVVKPISYGFHNRLFCGIWGYALRVRPFNTKPSTVNLTLNPTPQPE